MKKKAMCIAVVLALAFSLAGCTSQADYDAGYEAGRNAGIEAVKSDPSAYLDEAAILEAADKLETEDEQPAPSSNAQLERELDRYKVMNQQWKDAYERLLEEAGLDDDFDWVFLGDMIVASNGDPEVYVDNNSKYYHREGCSQLNDSPMPVHLSYVRMQEIEPCPVCEPVE